MVSDRGHVQIYLSFEGAVFRVFRFRSVLDRRFLFTKGNAHQIIFKVLQCRSAFPIHPQTIWCAKIIHEKSFVYILRIFSLVSAASPVNRGPFGALLGNVHCK